MSSLEIAAISMQLDQQRLKAVAHNVANATTPGYKRHVVRAEQFNAVMDATAASAAQQSVLPSSVPSLAEQTGLDLQPGAMRRTGQALDVAIEGDGFIELAKAGGRYVTRGGSLRLDTTGVLVTADGVSVSGQRGEIRIAGTEAAVSIERDGAVLVNGQEVDRIRLVRFERHAALQAEGPGLYRADNARESSTDSASSVVVRAGYQEASNVNSTREMLAMLETSRHYEAMQRAIQAHDEMTERTLRKLGDL